MAKTVTLTRGKVVVPDAYLFVRHVQKHKFLRPVEVAQPDGTTKSETVQHSDWLVTFHVYADKSERAELGVPFCGGVLRFPADGISDPEAEAYKRLDALTLTEGWAFEVTGDA